MPRFSIIICTLNREKVFCDTLQRVLDLLKGREDGEIIVVDQTRQHSDATERFLAEHAGDMQLCRVDFASLTRARNHGIRLARGEIVLFLDDDVLPSENLIDEHLACFADPKVWGVGGCTLSAGARKVSKRELSASQLREIELNVVDRFDLDWPRVLTWAPGCNMSFRRQNIIDVGGFDEAFYAMAIGEETEMCFRLRKAGGVIQYAPSAELVHLVDSTGGCRDARAEKERVAQLMDNGYYALRRMGRSEWKSWRVLFRQMKAIVLNRRSLREFSWPRRCIWCFHAVRRALGGRSRTAILPFSQSCAEHNGE